MIRALEACRFAGKNYSAGEVVPVSAVNKKMIAALINMGVIEVVEDPKPIEEPKPKPKARKAK